MSIFNEKQGEVAVAEIDVKYNKAKLEAIEMEKRAADAEVAVHRILSHFFFVWLFVFTQ